MALRSDCRFFTIICACPIFALSVAYNLAKSRFNLVCRLGDRLTNFFSSKASAP